MYCLMLQSDYNSFLCAGSQYARVRHVSELIGTSFEPDSTRHMPSGGRLRGILGVLEICSQTVKT